jgi:hypothetical protein
VTFEGSTSFVHIFGFSSKSGKDKFHVIWQDSYESLRESRAQDLKYLMCFEKELQKKKLCPILFSLSIIDFDINRAIIKTRQRKIYNFFAVSVFWTLS